MCGIFGAGERTRTFDLLITNQLHYRLCYTSNNSPNSIPFFLPFVKRILKNIQDFFKIPCIALIFCNSYGTIKGK